MGGSGIGINGHLHILARTILIEDRGKLTALSNSAINRKAAITADSHMNLFTLARIITAVGCWQGDSKFLVMGKGRRDH